MQDEQTDRWPRFQIVTYSPPTDIPNGWDAELLLKGAPDGLGYSVSHELMLLEDPESGPLVSFGIWGIYHRVCLDPRTGSVVHIGFGAFRRRGPHPQVFGTSHVVNSTLDQFIASVHAVTHRFPYDTWQPGEGPAFSNREEEWAFTDKLFDEWDNACRQTIDLLRMIDFAAVTNPDGFWMTFIADVRMGNYSTEDILRPRDR